MKPLLALAIALTIGTTAAADDAGRTVPIAYEWVVVPCESWSAAVAALVSAEGDPYVVAIPTTHGEHKWIVLKRVVSGGYVPPADMPWAVESFNTTSDASNRMSSLSSPACPLLMTMVDGRSVVVYLRNPETRSRAVRH